MGDYKKNNTCEGFCYDVFQRIGRIVWDRKHMWGLVLQRFKDYKGLYGIAIDLIFKKITLNSWIKVNLHSFDDAFLEAGLDCSIWYDFQDLSTLHKLADKVVLDR